jgi:hypothetical protein
VGVVGQQESRITLADVFEMALVYAGVLTSTVRAVLTHVDNCTGTAISVQLSLLTLTPVAALSVHAYAGAFVQVLCALINIYTRLVIGVQLVAFFADTIGFIGSVIQQTLVAAAEDTALVDTLLGVFIVHLLDITRLPAINTVLSIIRELPAFGTRARHLQVLVAETEVTASTLVERAWIFARLLVRLQLYVLRARTDHVTVTVYVTEVTATAVFYVTGRDASVFNLDISRLAGEVTLADVTSTCVFTEFSAATVVLFTLVNVYTGHVIIRQRQARWTGAGNSITGIRTSSAGIRIRRAVG